MKPSNKNLIWIDLEMTGLDPNNDRIIEIATVVTDKELNVLAEGPVFAVHQEQSLLDGMDEWNTKHHHDSGLVARVQESVISDQEAERKTIEFLMEYIAPGKSPMCGNTIYQDRRFLDRYMPALANYFHYRQIDVSSIKELIKRWKPSMMKGIEKKSKHLALSDIHDSIDELRYYRGHCFTF